MEKSLLKSKYPFEAYLEEVHAATYMGLDDDMSDNFDAWITELDSEELIRHANVLSKMLIDNFVK
jgi:hypothetical protein